MYVRYYKLKCLEEPKMQRFRIVTTQGLSFAQLMKQYSVRMPGFVSAEDTHFDNEQWDITTIWESKAQFDEAQKHPMRRMFWSRFEVEILRHDIQFIIIDGDTDEHFEPLSLD